MLTDLRYAVCSLPVDFGLVVGGGNGRCTLHPIAALSGGTLRPGGGVALLFAVIGSIACVLPSLRASRVDPLIALRVE